MNRKPLTVTAVIAIAGLLIAAGSMAADAAKDAPQIQLPPGFSEADMQACMAAATPGKMHEHLAKGAGVWEGRTTMWMAEGAEPATGDCKSTVTSILDGRFVKVEMSGDMPGMGPYSGLGIYGYDNVTKKFVSSWVDNMGTGIGSGLGELSSDGKTLTWQFTYNCPLEKKPVVIREVETITGPDTRTLEMFAKDRKSGREFKMMSIKLKRKSA